ncbi:hypothetical protein PHYC_02845 [Phycisphaerales bacterium]|nr:hypothetical protein PHYC_02845 [Phycisphaerales bacterium]
MKLESLVDILESEPFKPFVLHVADGRRLHVPNPHLVALVGGGRTVFVADPKRDRWNFVDLLMITGIEVTNGHSGRRRKSA